MSIPTQPSPTPGGSPSLPPPMLQPPGKTGTETQATPTVPQGAPGQEDAHVVGKKLSGNASLQGGAIQSKQTDFSDNKKKADDTSKTGTTATVATPTLPNLKEDALSKAGSTDTQQLKGVTNLKDQLNDLPPDKPSPETFDETTTNGKPRLPSTTESLTNLQEKLGIPEISSPESSQEADITLPSYDETRPSPSKEKETQPQQTDSFSHTQQPSKDNVSESQKQTPSSADIDSSSHVQQSSTDTDKTAKFQKETPSPTDFVANTPPQEPPIPPPSPPPGGDSPSGTAFFLGGFGGATIALARSNLENQSINRFSMSEMVGEVKQLMQSALQTVMDAAHQMVVSAEHDAKITRLQGISAVVTSSVRFAATAGGSLYGAKSGVLSDPEFAKASGKSSWEGTKAWFSYINPTGVKVGTQIGSSLGEIIGAGSDMPIKSKMAKEQVEKAKADAMVSTKKSLEQTLNSTVQTLMKGFDSFGQINDQSRQSLSRMIESLTKKGSSLFSA